MKKKNDNIVKFTGTGESGIKFLSEDSNATILIEHGPLTLQACKKVSDYVYNLPLEEEENSTLLELLKELLLSAERDQYMNGFIDGVNAVKAGTLEVLADRLLVTDGDGVF